MSRARRSPGSRPRRAESAGAALLLALAAHGCQPPLPEPLTRVAGLSPEGPVAPGEVTVEVRFSAPVAPDGIVDGRRAALCRGADAAEVASGASGEAGLPDGAPILQARIELLDGGLRLRLQPERPLWPMGSWALVLGKGLRDAAGRPVVDAQGRPRAVVHAFETGDLPAGALPRLALAEVLADAAPPEAGGEYAEIANLGSAAADLSGFRLVKRTASGGEQRCTLEPIAGEAMAGEAIAPGGRGLAVGGAYDGRYPLPADVPLYRCGTTALLGGLADDRAAALRIESPGGIPLGGLGWEAAAPRCPGEALARLDPAGPDAPGNLACGAPSPGR